MRRSLSGFTQCNDERLFVVFEALKRGMSVEKIHEITMIDEWFLNKLLHLVRIGRADGRRRR